MCKGQVAAGEFIGDGQAFSAIRFQVLKDGRKSIGMRRDDHALGGISLYQFAERCSQSIHTCKEVIPADGWGLRFAAY